MITVLQIRETPFAKFAGVDANVQALIQLFDKDDEINLLPTINYKKHRIPVIKQYFLSPHEIEDSIKRYNPDIIHIHGATTFTLPVAIWVSRKFKKPIALSTHFHPFSTLKRPFMGKLYFHLILKPCLKHVDTVFTINNEDTRILSKYTKHVVKIPHWSKFDRINGPIEKIPNQILFVGRLSGINKGFDHLQYLPKDKYKIILVGSGERELRSDMSHKKNISNDELRKLYLESSLLVVPSRYEAFSYATLEALYCQTPVVLSDRVRISDYLDGVEGVSIFNYGDYDAFVKAVDNTIGNHVNIDVVESTFSPLRIKSIYKAAYKKLSAV